MSKATLFYIFAAMNAVCVLFDIAAGDVYITALNAFVCGSCLSTAVDHSFKLYRIYDNAGTSK